MAEFKNKVRGKKDEPSNKPVFKKAASKIRRQPVAPKPVVKDDTKKNKQTPSSTEQLPLRRRMLHALVIVVWLVAGFYAAQFAMFGVMWGLAQLGVQIPASVNETALTTVVTSIVYVLALVIVVMVPYWIYKKRTTRDEMGLRQSLPRWRDLGLAPLVFIACFVSSAITIVMLQAYLPGFDALQRQEIPFNNTAYLQQYELLLIFFTLAIVAPVAEELLFRGYLFGKLRKKLPVFAVILITSVVFSALHLGIGMVEKLQWNAAVDTFILAIGMGLLRHYTGSVWASMLVHIIKNGIAFFVLFVLPRLVPMADVMQRLQ